MLTTLSEKQETGDNSPKCKDVKISFFWDAIVLIGNWKRADPLQKTNSPQTAVQKTREYYQQLSFSHKKINKYVNDKV